MNRNSEQECIPVGCVPPAYRPYLPGPGAGGVPGPGGVYLVRGGGGVPGPGGVVIGFGIRIRVRVPGPSLSPSIPGPRGGCNWSQGGVYLVPGGCTWSRGGCTWSGTPPPC